MNYFNITRTSKSHENERKELINNEDAPKLGDHEILFCFRCVFQNIL